MPVEMAHIACEANQIWRDDLERQPDENSDQIDSTFRSYSVLLIFISRRLFYERGRDVH